MGGIELQNKLADYHSLFAEYLLFLQYIGDTSGGEVYLDGYNITTNNYLGTSTASVTTADQCWNQGLQQFPTNLVVANFDSTSNTCNFYGSPSDTTTDTSTFYQDTAQDYTSVMTQANYWTYAMLHMNDVLQAKAEDILNGSDPSGQEFVEYTVISNEIERHQEELKKQRLLIMESHNKGIYDKEYNTTLIETTSQNTWYTMWSIVALFSALIAFVLCYSILSKKE
jgi:hypothetical protein